MVVQHNMSAANSNRQLGINATNLSKATEKLSSGYRINRAGDDAAGLSISEKMRSQIRGLDQASRNAQDGISLIQTAEGALGEIHSVVQRMRELAVQGKNDTNNDEDREAITKELSQLSQEIDRIGDQTQFNTKKLLNGDTTTVSLQVGANSEETIDVTLKSMKSSDISADQITFTDDGIDAADTAIKEVSDLRSQLGAYQNRLEHTIANADNSSENLQAAESRIRDVDMASEMVKYSKNNILQQAAQSMLAQANQAPQGVLSLLQ